MDFLGDITNKWNGTDERISLENSDTSNKDTNTTFFETPSSTSLVETLH